MEVKFSSPRPSIFLPNYDQRSKSCSGGMVDA